MRTFGDIGKFILVSGTALAVLAPFDTARASGFSVLYSFAGSDGDLPEAGLIMDSKGILYGTTYDAAAAAATVTAAVPSSNSLRTARKRCCISLPAEAMAIGPGPA